MQKALPNPTSCAIESLSLLQDDLTNSMHFHARDVQTSFSHCTRSGCIELSNVRRTLLPQTMSKIHY
jgi:hypothetical protein